MKKLSALRKSKKGFTLVEIIVVLVILAILAAIAIPTLIGYINDANEKQILTEARSVLVAAQAQAVEEYGVSSTAAAKISAAEINEWIGEDLVASTAGTNADTTAVTGPKGTVTGLVVTNAKVTALVYTNNGYTATYNGTTWSTAKAA